jgi:hypothetical protein
MMQCGPVTSTSKSKIPANERKLPSEADAKSSKQTSQTESPHCTGKGFQAHAACIAFSADQFIPKAELFTDAIVQRFCVQDVGSDAPGQLS